MNTVKSLILLLLLVPSQISCQQTFHLITSPTPAPYNYEPDQPRAQQVLSSSITNSETFVLLNERLRYPEARCKCFEQGMVLASIHSTEENIAARDLCYTQPYICWIGLFREAGETEWYWIDASPVDYTNWHETNPDVSIDQSAFAFAFGSGTGAFADCAYDIRIRQPALCRVVSGPLPNDPFCNSTTKTPSRGATSYDRWIGRKHPSDLVGVNELATITEGAYIKKICVWQVDDYIRRIRAVWSDGYDDSAGGSATGTMDCVEEAHPGDCFKSYNVEWTVGRHVTRLFFADGASHIHRLGTGSTDPSEIAGHQHSSECLTAITVDSYDKVYRIKMGFKHVSDLNDVYVKSCAEESVTHATYTFIIIVVLLCVQIVIATYLVRKNCCLNPKTMHYAKGYSSETN